MQFISIYMFISVCIFSFRFVFGCCFCFFKALFKHFATIYACHAWSTPSLIEARVLEPQDVFGEVDVRK